MVDRIVMSGAYVAAALLAGCAQGDSISTDAEPYSGISSDETVYLGGTEPFWGIEVSGESAKYSAPEDLDGTEFAVSRFAGNNGIGYSGELKGEAIQIAVTPGECSDGMSDASYPFTVTVSWGDTTLLGCAHTDSQPYTGGETQ